MTLEVFISYKHQDVKRNQWVEKLYRDLRNVGIDAKLDKYEVGPGGSFSNYMARGIRECDFVLFIITPKAVKAVESGKGALAFEMEISNARRMSDPNGFRIIPIFREGKRTSTYLSDHRYLDFRNDADYDASFAVLLQWLFGEIKPPALGDFSFESEREAINYARELTRIARNEFKAKNYSEAHKKLRIALHLDPDDISTFGLYGRTLTNLGRFDEAITPLTKAIELTQFASNRKIYLTSRLLANYFRGKYDLALEDGNKIIEESPKHREGHRLKATTWVVTNNLDNALVDINIALEKGDYLCASAIKAIILNKSNDVIGSSKELEMCKDIQPKDGVDFYCLALAYANLQHEDIALEFLQKSIEYDPKCLPRALKDPLFFEISNNPKFVSLISEAQLKLGAGEDR